MKQRLGKVVGLGVPSRAYSQSSLNGRLSTNKKVMLLG